MNYLSAHKKKKDQLPGRAIAFFLMTVFLSNTLTTYLFFAAEAVRIKSEMANLVSGWHSLEGITIFRFSVSAYEGQDRREIIFEGKLFDVVKSVRINDSVYIYAISDTKEDEWVADFTAHLQHEFGNRSRQGHICKNPKIAATYYVQSRINNFSGMKAWETKSVTLAFRVRQFNQQNYYPVPTPPPRQLKNHPRPVSISNLV